MAELKSCPFCGGEAEITKLETENNKFVSSAGILKYTTYRARVSCKKCGAEISREWDVGDRESDYIVFGEPVAEAWNRRTPKERGGEK